MIKYVGIEVECGIDEDNLLLLENKYKDRINVGSDASVYVSCYDIKDAELRFCCKPTEVREFLKDIWELGRIEQNSSCGNHFHFSFISSEYYDIFKHYKFISFFLQKYNKKFQNQKKYIDRLYNDYCYKFSSEDTFIKHLTFQKTRYYCVNFHSLKKYNTIEFRIMPFANCFTEHYNMYKFIVSTMKSYISYLRNKEYFVTKKIDFYFLENSLKNEYEITIDTINKEVYYVSNSLL